jgi:nucleoside-diphosphate-sugar epimerase
MKILVLGCGWVGEEFALRQISLGAEVCATTTNPDKAVRLGADGISAYCVDFDQAVDLSMLPTSFDYVLTSIPATSKHTADVLSQRFERVRTFLETLTYRKHIFLSSVGVYPDQDGTFDESCAVNLNERLLRAEQILAYLPDTLIYRLGGLFGKNRIFAKYFENKVCTTGHQRANFIHLEDVVQLIALGFDQLQAGVYNIVCPKHPTKEEVVRASAKKYGFDLPALFEPQDSFQKYVVADKIINTLGYTFKYPSPLEF